MLVIFFTYFVVAVVFNPIKWANRMRKVGLAVPNVDSGRPTADYVDAIMTRFMIKWAVFLIGASLLWSFAPYWIQIPRFEFGVKSLILIIGIGLAVGKTLCLKNSYKEAYTHNDFGEVLIIEAL